MGQHHEVDGEPVGQRATSWLIFDSVPADFATPLWNVGRRSAEVAARDPNALKRSVRVNVDPGEQVGRILERLEAIAASGADEAVVEPSLAVSTVDESLELAQAVARKRGW